VKLLLIEDSEVLRNTLVKGLSRLGATIDSTGDGQEGLRFALSIDYDVIILDLMLPSLDGISILKRLRLAETMARVLILSARDQVPDRVLGLNLGADDYLTKPFAFDELHARLLSLYRRRHDRLDVKVDLNGLLVDTVLKKAIVDGEAVPLTHKEYQILERLAMNRGKVITYGSLEDYLAADGDYITQNTLEAHVSSARKKLRQVGVENIISTRRGFGYVIE
jgi:DNA-binding response OmpR family regulator